MHCIIQKTQNREASISFQQVSFGLRAAGGVLHRLMHVRDNVFETFTLITYPANGPADNQYPQSVAAVELHICSTPIEKELEHV